MSDFQDWKPVVWSKSKPTSKSNAIQRGYQVKTMSRVDPSISAKNKIDQNELGTLQKLKKSFSQAMQKARIAKKLTQKQLAQQLHVKPQVINQYESGRGVLDPALINKIRNVLQIKGKLT